MTIEHPFAQYVRILGKGRKGTRSLTYEEALAAMGHILRGETEDVQLGAFMMLLRVKEENADELAGFTQATKNHIKDRIPANLSADLDWSSYAGKRRQLPWYIWLRLHWLIMAFVYSCTVQMATQRVAYTPAKCWTT